jgi:hypothetical protein
MRWRSGKPFVAEIVAVIVPKKVEVGGHPQ